MKVAIIGGGPAGLYLSLLLKNADSRHDVTVVERNAPHSTFGWGVVFSDQTLENFQAADAATYQQITKNFAHWDDIDVFIKGRKITSGGHGFSGIARQKLLNILQNRAAEVGVKVRHNTEVRRVDDLQRLGLGVADLIVAADGINSAVRGELAAEFHPSLDVRSAKYIWLATTFKFDAFTFYFVENEHGVFQAHCYRFNKDTSTFVVECDEASWRSAGFDKMELKATIAACEKIFAPWLEGHPLISNDTRPGSPWTSFTLVRNQHWFYKNITLIGDAAHSAHFSIGSGTKLAMEDAIALAKFLSSEAKLSDAMQKYQDERMTEALRLQNAARNSMEWFENVKRYIRLEPEQFTYSLLTRSQRVSHENLRLRDSAYLGGVERWFASKASRAESGTHKAVPPMFTPFTLREMRLENRIVVAPMDMYCAKDGTPNDFHLVHLGSRALGGAGLVMTEMTCVSPEARITPGCTGMYFAEHAEAWCRVTHFVHANSRAKICLQLGHSGRKGSTKIGWEGMDEPLDSGNWQVIGPSAVPFCSTAHLPRAMTKADMDKVKSDFVRATQMAIECKFDMIELHCAHGYLLSSFITPVSNKRKDEYGGSLENRLRFPLEIFSAMRAVWPKERPMSVRISATDWVEDGITTEESVAVAKAFIAAAADIIHVSAGQTSSDARPVYGRMFQTPFSDRIRNEAGIQTIAVGNILSADQVNGIIASGRADLCALARPHLSDPHWTLHAAAEAGYEEQYWPPQYLTGKQQLERNIKRGPQ